MTAEELAKKIKQARMWHTSESEMQESLETFLTQEGIEFDREFALNTTDRVDFLTKSGIAIECKIKGQPIAIHRQLERYATHESVKAIILYTSKFMKVKNKINDKPAIVVHAGLSWL